MGGGRVPGPVDSGGRTFGVGSLGMRAAQEAHPGAKDGDGAEPAVALQSPGLGALLAGCLGVFPAMGSGMLDTRRFSWREPFQVNAGGMWVFVPQAINTGNRALRQEAMRLLSDTALGERFWDLVVQTRASSREHMAYFRADGSMGRVYTGTRYAVGREGQAPGANDFGHVHTHPVSERLAAPSAGDDFALPQPLRLLMMVESGSGRVWCIFPPSAVCLIGRVTEPGFEPLNGSDPHSNQVWVYTDPAQYRELVRARSR